MCLLFANAAQCLVVTSVSFRVFAKPGRTQSWDCRRDGQIHCSHTCALQATPRALRGKHNHVFCLLLALHTRRLALLIMISCTACRHRLHVRCLTPCDSRQLHAYLQICGEQVNARASCRTRSSGQILATLQVAILGLEHRAP